MPSVKPALLPVTSPPFAGLKGYIAEVFVTAGVPLGAFLKFIQVVFVKPGPGSSPANRFWYRGFSKVNSGSFPVIPMLVGVQSCDDGSQGRTAKRSRHIAAGEGKPLRCQLIDAGGLYVRGVR